MYIKLISSILVVALFIQVGCYSAEVVTVTEYKQFEEAEGKPNKIIVTTKDYETYHFFLDSGYSIENDTLYGKGILFVNDEAQKFDGKEKIALSDIVSFQFDEFDGTKTAFGVGVVIGCSLIIIGVISAVSSMSH
jgi:hypothetical protein